jgi:hypothetical protein
MSDPKETFCFQRFYKDGLEAFEQRHFQHRQPHHVWCGEASTSSLHLDFVAARMAARFPDARIIVCLREPAERAYAHWWMNHAGGLEPLDFEATMQTCLTQDEANVIFEGEDGAQRFAAPDRPPYRAYLYCGYYARHLKRYFDLFGRDQVHVIRFEDIKQDASAVVLDIQRFLGLEPCPPIDLSVLNPQLGRQATRVDQSLQQWRLKEHLPQWLKRAARKVLAWTTDRRPAPSPATLAMLRDHYRSHNEDLEALLGWDLTSWKPAQQPALDAPASQTSRGVATVSGQ